MPAPRRARNPTTIPDGVAPGRLRALAMQWLSGQELKLFSFVGLILLVGLVTKNGVMMVDSHCA